MGADTLNLSDIQHFSTGDGPGIRTTVFLKGCPLRCPWCHNPETWTAERVVMTYEKAHRSVVSGVIRSVSDVAREVLADIDFYEQSGGGLTVSGGECLLDPAGTAALCRAVKDPAALMGHKPVHTVIDTAGCVPYTAFETVNPYADLYFFDLKTADAEKYASIGGSLSRVTDNIAHLLRDGKTVRVRIPLIPDFNTDPDSLSALADTCVRLGTPDVDLLPFHRLGSGKYAALGMDYAYRITPPLPVRDAERMGGAFRAAGLHARVET